MKLKFIYWFAFYNLASPTVRYRGQYPLEFFKKEYGINSYFICPDYHPLRILLFLKAYCSALFFPKAGSVIVIQSLNSNFMYANALKLLVRLRKSISVYDLDDADYLRFPPDTIYHFVKNCSYVSVGSKELVRNMSKINSNTFLVTCPVPDLRIVKLKRNELFTIGWIGDFGTGHKESLMNLFFPAIKDLPFKVKLILLGVGKKEEYDFLKTYFSSFENVEVEIPQDVVWTDEEAIQRRIAEFDVGIATLLDNEFYRSKSAFKMKQCFNNGVPVLSSNIAENNLFLDEGKNGFYCTTPGEFRKRIIEIKDMSDTRYAELSSNARGAINRFDLKRYCDDVIATYDKNVD